MLRALGTKRSVALCSRPVRFYSASYDPFGDTGFKPQNRQTGKFDRKKNRGVSRDAALKVKNPHKRKEQLFPQPQNDGGEQFKVFGGSQRAYPVFEGKTHERALADPPVLPNRVTKMHKWIENEADRFVRLLRLFVREPTIAKACLDHGQTYAFHNMIQIVRNEFIGLGFKVTTPEFKHLDYADKTKHPPFILARPAHEDPSKPIIVVYANYDTVNVSEMGWAHAPYDMGRFEGSLTGRGVAAKAVIAGWLAALSTMHTANVKPTANFRFCFDPMGELGAGALDTALGLEDTRFFKDADAVLVSQGQWNSSLNPSIIHGQRGCHNYYLNIKGTEFRNDAGRFAGARREPLTELMHLMAEVTSYDQNTLLPRAQGLDLHVAQPSEEDVTSFKELGTCVEELKDQMGADRIKKGRKSDILMKMWTEPAVSIQSIKHGYEPEEAYPTTIPKHATARFAIRTVPNMDMDSMDRMVTRYFAELHNALKSDNQMHFKMLSRYPWWLASTNNWHYDTAKQAIRSVYNVEPELTREGGTSPVPALFEKHLQKTVLCLPIGLPSDAPRSVEENFSETNFINGIKTFVSYMYFVGENARVTGDKFVSDVAFPLPIKLPPPLKQMTREFNNLINASEEIPPPQGEPVLLSAEFDHNDYADRLEKIENIKIRTGDKPVVYEHPTLPPLVMYGPLTQESAQLNTLLNVTREPSDFPKDYMHPEPYQRGGEAAPKPQGSTKDLLVRLRQQLESDGTYQRDKARKASLDRMHSEENDKATKTGKGKPQRAKTKLKVVKMTKEEEKKLDREIQERLFEG